jgi:hypothetical protein
LNKDGKLDMVCAKGSDGFSVLMGSGDGVFSEATNYLPGSECVGMSCGDYNADGNLDLAYAIYGSGNLSVRKGNGTGAFDSEEYHPVSAARGTASAPLDGDSVPDIVVGQAGNRSSGFDSVYIFHDRIDIPTITSLSLASGTSIVVQWASEPNNHYTVQKATNSLQSFLPVATTIPTHYPVNAFTDTVSSCKAFYRIVVEPRP